MSPLPATAIIPANWVTHHRPVAAQTMVSGCRIYRIAEGPPPYPIPEDWTGRVLLWTGTCRVQELKREASIIPGEQPTELRQYMVGLPFENGQGVGLPQLMTGERGDVVEAVDRVFNLKQSMAGSLLWQNDFIAWENQTQQNPD
ncbi:DUF6093 family protein [Paeniglutamicibacter sp. NPDC012692]|uniref:DUF6093 family protein n=1 Tax=Paeniglutamicibacter sp. NPDC012692 TaxID=3364388 RepID=UPI0036BF7950